MLSLEKAISIADQIVNPADAEALKTMIYELRKENIDFKVKYQEASAKLKILEEWEMTKKKYKEHQTSSSTIVHVLSKKKAPEIFYCSVCFSEKSIVPLQPLSYAIKDTLLFQISGDEMISHKFCPNCKNLYYLPKT